MSAPQVMFVFPGQGSQYRGMGSDLHDAHEEARAVYERASAALGFDIQQLSFEDPQDEIGLTRNTQPALLAHQVACLRVFEKLTGGAVQPTLGAGHSLGEYTALVAAGSLSLEDGLQLVRTRGELMGRHGEGGMVALTVDQATAKEVADRFYCQVASCNLPEQTVVGGRDADLDALVKWAAEHMPRKRAVALATEGAFHTYLMVTAAREFRTVLEATEFAMPAYPVLSNYSAQPHENDADAIRTRLFFQLFNPVNWVGCLQTAMAAGIQAFVELGGGLGKGEGPAEKRPNLEGIIKKTLKSGSYEAEYLGAINLATLEATAARFAA
ncbi:MAG: ACP S-malonyltransferase [Chromatiales bacterium]|nr:MAG: ACP S-malonyltransferase [Chromatiales bacterium]